MTDVSATEGVFPPASERLKLAENTASAARRNLLGASPDWGLLVAEAQAAIGYYQPRWAAQKVRDLHDEQAASPLIAASRIAFDASLRDADVDWDEVERDRLKLLASCGYAMYGNFPSAAAAQASISPRHSFSPAEWTAAALGNPRIIPKALEALPREGPFADLLNAAFRYLNSGEAADAIAFNSALPAAALACETISDAVFIRCCRTISHQLIYLACANLKKFSFGHTFRQYVENIISNGRSCLLPPQSDIIWAGNLLSSSANALVTIPTSTGKTLLAELAMARALEKPGSVCVYVAPYVALGRQVYDCIIENAPGYVSVRGYFGSFNSDIDDIDPFGRTILIATPERFDAILRSGSVTPYLTTVIFDEAHGIENGTRGVRLEGLISRLKLQQTENKGLRLILLSAVLTNGQAVRHWLGEDTVHHDHSWRPTARRVGFWMAGGRLAWLYGNDPLRPAGQSALDQIGHTQLDWPSAIDPVEHHGAIEKQRPNSLQNVAHLAIYLEKQSPGPVLVACYTKGSTRGVATAIAGKRTERTEHPPGISELITLVETSFAHLKPLAAMLRKGVAYHNASLPHEVKARLEEAIRGRALDFVAATTTLAEGVDMPFRTTVIYEWLIGFGTSQAPMSALMFRNIAGRCGRAGQYVEGDTVVYDNVLGSLSFTSNETRRAAQTRVLSDPPPLSSAIANDNLAPEEVAAVRAALSGQLMASIPENPALDRVDLDLAANTYAASIGASPAALLSSIRDELLDDTHGAPFAKAASPMWLTELGVAANGTGFSARTCREIIRYLDNAEIKPASSLAAEVLLEFGAIPEQGNYVLRDIATQKKGSKFYVKRDDMVKLADDWLQATPFIVSFTSLPKAMSSKAKVTPIEWAKGDVEYELVAAQYDKFIDLMEYSFGSYLLWLIRAFNQLAPFSTRAAPMPDWSGLADQFATARELDDFALDDILNGPGEGE